MMMTMMWTDDDVDNESMKSSSYCIEGVTLLYIETAFLNTILAIAIASSFASSSCFRVVPTTSDRNSLKMFWSAFVVGSPTTTKSSDMRLFSPSDSSRNTYK